MLFGPLAALLSACASPPAEPTRIPTGLRSPYAGYRSPRYARGDAWLCRPDLPAQVCHADLTATELRPNGSRAVAPHRAAAHPEIDCFYIYPTVDNRLGAANSTRFDDLSRQRAVTVIQVARLSEVCRIYAPLYRQITLGTYFLRPEAREPYLAVAFSDVLDAFLHYLGQYNGGRPLVLIGHSQGGDMVVRLLKRLFDDDPRLRERLLLAMPIGAWVEVKRGRTTGGTFRNLPICTGATERGCVIAYRSHAEGERTRGGLNRPAPGNQTVCVNPTDIAGNRRRHFARAYFPMHHELRGVEGIQTPFVMLRDFYTGQCRDAEEGYRYLAVAAAPGPGDRRTSVVNLRSWKLRMKDLGLHILDLQFAQGDLIDLIAARWAPRAPAAPVGGAAAP